MAQFSFQPTLPFSCFSLHSHPTNAGTFSTLFIPVPTYERPTTPWQGEEAVRAVEGSFAVQATGRTAATKRAESQDLSRSHLISFRSPHAQFSLFLLAFFSLILLRKLHPAPSPLLLFGSFARRSAPKVVNVTLSYSAQSSRMGGRPSDPCIHKRE